MKIFHIFRICSQAHLIQHWSTCNLCKQLAKVMNTENSGQIHVWKWTICGPFQCKCCHSSVRISSINGMVSWPSYLHNGNPYGWKDCLDIDTETWWIDITQGIYQFRGHSHGHGKNCDLSVSYSQHSQIFATFTNILKTSSRHPWLFTMQLVPRRL